MEDKQIIDYSPLLSGVLTVSDRDVFLGQLDQVEEEMFKQGVGSNTDSGPSDAEAKARKQAPPAMTGTVGHGRMTENSLGGSEQAAEVIRVLESVLPYERKAAFVNLLHEGKIDPSDLVKIQDVIREIREYMGKIPVLSLTLAESPREELLKKIALAVSDQTQQPLFLDITIDSSILGGSKLEWGGKVEDYSLGKKLEEYFNNSKVKGQNSKV